jgi:uncharacterized protein
VDVARKAAVFLDRTAVLFVGLALGGVITYSFFAGGQADEAAATGALPRGSNAAAVTATPAAPRQLAAVVTPRLASAAAEGREIHVGVFGDSFGDGIHSALYRQLPSDQKFKVHKFSQQATGFTRYRSLNLLDDTRRRLDRQPVDIAVVSFGANDMQGIYQDGRGAEFMSDRWKEIVSQRVTEVVELLRSRGAAVYWVGLPRMREADYDRNVQQMNAFYAERMQALNVPFVDTVPASVDQNGAYAPYLTDPDKGQRINARLNDGIHMTIPGYALLTRGLADRIKQSVAEARNQSGARQAQQNAGGTRSQG